MTLEETINEEFLKRTEELTNKITNDVFEMTIASVIQLAELEKSLSMNGREALLLLAQSMAQNIKDYSTGSLN